MTGDKLKAAHDVMTAHPTWKRYVLAFHAYNDTNGKAEKRKAEPELAAAEAAWNDYRRAYLAAAEAAQ